MISTIILSVICTLGIGFFLVCLYGFDHAAKQRPINGVLLLLPGQSEQRVLRPRFGETNVSPAPAVSSAEALVLPFPRNPAWALRHVS